MRLWAMNLVAMNLADAVLTLMLMERGHKELSPIWQFAIAQGDWNFIIAKVCAGALVAGVLLYQQRELLLQSCTLGLTLVVLWNGGLLLLS